MVKIKRGTINVAQVVNKISEQCNAIHEKSTVQLRTTCIIQIHCTEQPLYSEKLNALTLLHDLYGT